MPNTYGFDHFGKKAWFDEEQAIVVKALASDYLKLFSQNVLLEIEKGEIEDQLREKDQQLSELQNIVDVLISPLDPDQG
jgi:hypothetical protein